MLGFTDEEWVRKFRAAVHQSNWVLLDGREYMIMWKQYDEFGIRNLVTGEQYAFTYSDAIKHSVTPLVLCPIDIEKTDGF